MHRLSEVRIIDRKLLARAESVVRDRLEQIPGVAIILGSGLGPFADKLGRSRVINASDIPGYPASTVVAHKGRWIAGEANGTPLIAIQGRVHAYEGYTPQEVAFPVHLLATLGVKVLIVTNAAGAINRYFEAGEFMVIADQINFTFMNPLIGPNNRALGPRFPDMIRAYDPELTQIALRAATELGYRAHSGVYFGVSGPSYETAAEIRMAQTLGADAVGMSTIPEVITAAYRGLRVLGISLISNKATGIAHQKLSHDEVTLAGKQATHAFERLIEEILTLIKNKLNL